MRSVVEGASCRAPAPFVSLRLPPPRFGEDLIQSAQQIGEVAVARFRRRSLERAAQSGHDAGMGRWSIDSDYPPIHAPHL